MTVQELHDNTTLLLAKGCGPLKVHVMTKDSRGNVNLIEIIHPSESRGDIPSAVIIVTREVGE